MAARWVVSTLLASACAAVPQNPLARDPLIDVDRTTGRVATRAAAPIQFVIELGDRDVRMPQSIFIDGIDRVASESCPTESGIGIGVFPALDAVAPMRGGPAATGGLVVDWAGPVIARLHVTWMTAYTCGGSQQASGTSTFTIFPNGRIVRHDVATPSTTTLSVIASCGCGGSSPMSFTSFWAFTATQVVNPDGSPWSTGSPTGCAVYPNHTIGIAWSDSNTHVRQTSAISAFVHDWAADVTTLQPTQQEVFSAIILSKQTAAANCGGVLTDLDDFPITIAGAQISTDDGGVYTDARKHAGRVEITSLRVVPKGFTISLDVGEFAAVSRTPSVADDRWYAAQSDGTHTLFWFRDGLQVGQTIAIEPR
jgi:hypothetical protein